MPPPRRPDPEPLETDDVKVVLVGTIAWFVALVLALVFHARLSEAGNESWVWTLLAGCFLGLVGVRYVLRRRAALRRDADRGDAPL
jgi:uncharacterized membrane protein